MRPSPPDIVVLTTVHPPDDPRIRDRTVRVLASKAVVRYATRAPGPSDRSDHEWRELRGGRARRWVDALRVACCSGATTVSIHDPELIPAGLIARAVCRRRVVVDVHEDVPAQIREKEWLPTLLRRPAAAAARWLLLVAERFLDVTLAEAGYQRLFRRPHLVLPNYPDVARLPAPAADGRYIVYVGDVREVRGALVAIDAVAAMSRPLPLHFVGRVAPHELTDELVRRAAAAGVELHLHGFLPHAEAMSLAAGASVGLSPLLDIENYRWSLPTKVIEYLALGIPVAASDLPGTAEAVDGLAGVRLVPPGDVLAWTRALDEITSEPRMRDDAAAESDVVRSRFVWPAADLLAAYGLATGDGSAAPG